VSEDSLIPPSISSPTEEAQACPNCGSTIAGAYCGTCGQKAQSLREPVRRFVVEALDEFIGLDGRFWRTMGLMLFRPGRLTNEYLTGRRVRYLRPLRIYISTTIIFFFLISVLDPAESLQQAMDRENAELDLSVPVEQRQTRIVELIAAAAQAVTEKEHLVDSLGSQRDSIASAFASDSTAGAIADSVYADRRNELEDAIDDALEEEGALASLRSRNALRIRRFEWQRSVLDDYPPDSLIRRGDLIREANLRFPDSIDDTSGVTFGLPDWLPRSPAVERLNAAQTNEETSEALAELGRNTIERLPVVMFLLLPVFAFLMKVLFVRRKWYYTEHLVFALHTHAFAFTVFSFAALTSGLSFVPDQVSEFFLFLSATIPLYFYIAMKLVYGQGWIKTALKAMMLAWLYGFVLLIGFLAAIALAAALG